MMKVGGWTMKDGALMPEVRWTRVAVTPSCNETRHAVAAAMFAAGAEGLQDLGDGFVTHLPAAVDAAAFVASVRATDAALEADISALDNIDWSQKWKERITAHRLGTLTVTPPWLAAGRDPATTIVIEPAMAFGTGEHPTTRGVVRLMQGVIRPGDSVADLGSGSAVLSIAAAKLGAARVYAIEIDPDATGNAEENIATNHVGDRVAALEGDAGLFLPLVAPVRVILANIISSVLIELLPLMSMTLGEDGSIILSGILYEERDRMLQVLADGGWQVVAEDHEDQWWSVRAERART